jgi:hypothetical protein
VTTCRDILTDAFNALGVIGFGGQPTADEFDGGLSAMGAIVLELHGARAPLRDVDVSVDYLASENERVRVEAGADIVVTLPNSVLVREVEAPGDYGFCVSSCPSIATGSAGAADGYQSRPPRDGARIEIVGTTQALYFYRSDINAWTLAGPLTIDGPTPLNARYDGALAALVAERLCDRLNVAPSPALIKRIARGNAALLVQPSRVRGQTRPAYL